MADHKVYGHPHAAMHMQAVTVATVTLARNAAEEKLIVGALGALKAYPVITADGGSRPRLISSLHKLGVQIVCPKRKGLVCQVKASLRAALDASHNPFVLYTEPDKILFFNKNLETFLAHATKEHAHIVLASRNTRSFNTFPAGQLQSETFMNDATAVALGQTGDYCYGPMLLTRAAAESALDSPENLGWGWRFWLLGRSHLKKQRFRFVESSLPCPKDQRKENMREDQLYRFKQLKQNLEGLFLGLNLA
jgi:hypothetical protein